MKKMRLEEIVGNNYYILKKKYVSMVDVNKIDARAYTSEDIFHNIILSILENFTINDNTKSDDEIFNDIINYIKYYNKHKKKEKQVKTIPIYFEIGGEDANIKEFEEE